MTPLTKKLKPKSKKLIFIADLKTCWVFQGFEQLSSTITWGAMQLLSQPKYPWFLPNFQVRYIHRSAVNVLTLWELGYDIFVVWNGPKTSSCQLPYQRHSSSANCTKELFKGSNRSANHLICSRKKFLVGGCGFFVTDVMTEVVLGSFWLMLPDLGPNH